jgi:hypothetical protein
MRLALVGVVVAAFLFGGSAALVAQPRSGSEPRLPREKMAAEYFGACRTALKLDLPHFRCRLEGLDRFGTLGA